MPLPLALVFHFNQHTNENALLASAACYRGLLNVLRAHPGLKFNLHFSGTLLRALAWFDPAVLDMVKAGVDDGQFELLGSTYAQNVPYASDDWDNAQQIALHRQVLKDMFGVAPVAFWNAERCWRQNLVPLMAEAGYRVVPVETHILRAAGVTEATPVTTSHNGQSIIAVWDDNALRDRFNYAAWFGRRAQLMRYLQTYLSHPRVGDLLPVYAEDAEAMGLWNWSAGFLPHQAWANLDALLTEMERAGQFDLRHLSATQPLGTVEALPDGAAKWMNAALQRPDAPYHEEGFTDWFDFNQRSAKNTYFRRLFGVFRSRLQSLGSARSDPGYPQLATNPAGIFYRQAIENFCSHQYEFGCIGVGGRGYWGWENVRATFMFARASEIAEDYANGLGNKPTVWVEDVTGDGSDEQLFCDGRHLAVFSAYGARLLYWFDLPAGCQLVGNQLAVPLAKFNQGTTKLPRLRDYPAIWLPDTFTPDLKPYQALKRKASLPMQRHLPEWIWEREQKDVNVYGLPAAAEGARPLTRAQMGAFTDALTLDGRSYDADLLYDYRFEPGGLVYLLLLPDDETFMVEKRIRQTTAGLVVSYGFENRAAHSRPLTLTSTFELTPDYAAALGRWPSPLAFLSDGTAELGMHNTHTGHRLLITAQPAPYTATQQRSVLAGELQLLFKFDLAPNQRATLEVQLQHQTPAPL